MSRSYYPASSENIRLCTINRSEDTSVNFISIDLAKLVLTFSSNIYLDLKCLLLPKTSIERSTGPLTQLEATSAIHATSQVNVAKT
jgi:hypothetical protein